MILYLNQLYVLKEGEGVKESAERVQYTMSVS